MTLCREWNLVKCEPEERRSRPLYCRSWGCELCNPKRRSQLMALAGSGLPNRFITLTINPTVGLDPADRLRMLARAWRVIVQRLRRQHEKQTIDYLAIVEATKQGEPHLHILFRGPYLPQGVLSEWMRELVHSPIVDIRLIRNQKEVVRYIAKYIAKAPAQFGHAKRYWCSRTYELDRPAKYNPRAVDPFPWKVDRRPLHEIVYEWIHEGFEARRGDGDETIGLPIRSPPPWARLELPRVNMVTGRRHVAAAFRPQGTDAGSSCVAPASNPGASSRCVRQLTDLSIPWNREVRKLTDDPRKLQAWGNPPPNRASKLVRRADFRLNLIPSR